MAKWDFTTEFLGKWTVHHDGGIDHRYTYDVSQTLSNGEKRRFIIERTPYKTSHDAFEVAPVTLASGYRVPANRKLLFDSMWGGLKKVAERVDLYAATTDPLNLEEVMLIE